MKRNECQAEQISLADIAANLRYPDATVRNALHFSLVKGWVEALDDGRYSLSLPWFRTVTRVLARKNLLAGVRETVL